VPDVNKIFGLFSNENNNNQPPGEVFVDFMNSPEAKIGMFVKLIQNNIVFNQKIKQFFKQANKEFDEEATKKSSEFSVYNRAWYYIKGVDIDNKDHLYAVVKQDTHYLLESLGLALKYFESKEEYEKCAHIHKIEKIVKEI